VVRRERILGAAEDLFAADGFDATPTARIAGRAVVAKGLLFYYFPRKLDQANSHRFNGPTPDLGATAEIVSGALLARPERP
jgi:AcrR family transcriptional regulator